jgi:hypothetical protein
MAAAADNGGWGGGTLRCCWLLAGSGQDKNLQAPAGYQLQHCNVGASQHLCMCLVCACVVLQERSAEKLKQFFEAYGPAEAAAMCYLLATSNQGLVGARESVTHAQQAQGRSVATLPFVPLQIKPVACCTSVPLTIAQQLRVQLSLQHAMPVLSHLCPHPKLTQLPLCLAPTYTQTCCCCCCRHHRASPWRLLLPWRTPPLWASLCCRRTCLGQMRHRQCVHQREACTWAREYPAHAAAVAEGFCGEAPQLDCMLQR